MVYVAREGSYKMTTGSLTGDGLDESGTRQAKLHFSTARVGQTCGRDSPRVGHKQTSNGDD